MPRKKTPTKDTTDMNLNAGERRITITSQEKSPLPMDQGGTANQYRVAIAARQFYRWLLEERAKQLPDGEEKQAMLGLIEFFTDFDPSARTVQKAEWEARKREWEAEDKAKEADRRFILRELNRMDALPEPVFVLDLPDDTIQKIASRFDTVGKVLFGVQVTADRLVHSRLEAGENWDRAVTYVRNHLLKAVGQEGYNLIGSRLIQYGYLHRDDFLSELSRENRCRP